MHTITNEDGKKTEINQEQYDELYPSSLLDGWCSGQIMFFIGVLGEIVEDTFRDNLRGTKAMFQGSIHKTREAAAMEVLRRESMAKRWIPKGGTLFWHWSLDVAYNSQYNKFDQEDIHYAIIGNVHKTPEAAEEWGKKYSPAFKYIFE